MITPHTPEKEPQQEDIAKKMQHTHKLKTNGVITHINVKLINVRRGHINL